MPRYFFDFWEDGTLTSDEDGTDVPSFEAAKDEAVIDIAELAKDLLPGSGPHHELKIVVRNGAGDELIKLAFNFELLG